MPEALTQIGPGTKVTLVYKAFDEDNDVVDEADEAEPLDYIHGYGQLVPGLERGVEGLVAGQRKEIQVSPHDGYGEHDAEGVFEVDRSDFPEPDAVELDDEFVAEGPDGSQMLMRVVDAVEGGFLVDTNHPLAGVTLRYQVEVKAVRPATDEEIAEAERELEESEACGCGEDHDHGHDHGHEHDHGHDHDHGQAGGELVQLRRRPADKGKPS